MDSVESGHMPEPGIKKNENAVGGQLVTKEAMEEQEETQKGGGEGGCACFLSLTQERRGMESACPLPLTQVNF